VTAKVEEKKTEAATTVVEASSTTEAVTEVAASGDKPIKAMTDAERAAIRAARFGGAAAVAGDEKKLERAKRFGLPVTAASNGKTGKIGAVPSVDLVSSFKRRSLTSSVLFLFFALTKVPSFKNAIILDQFHT